MAQTKEGVDELVRRATDGTSEPVEFVMEPTGLAWLPLAAELSRRGHRVYLPKPAKTHALRKFLAQHTKTDAIDACTAALVRHVDQRATELRVPRAAQTTLRLMVKQRSRLGRRCGEGEEPDLHVGPARKSSRGPVSGSGSDQQACERVPSRAA